MWSQFEQNKNSNGNRIKIPMASMASNGIMWSQFERDHVSYTFFLMSFIFFKYFIKYGIIHICLLTLMKTLLSKPVRLQNSLLLTLLGYSLTIVSGVQFSFHFKDPWCPQLVPFEISNPQNIIRKITSRKNKAVRKSRYTLRGQKTPCSPLTRK